MKLKIILALAAIEATLAWQAAAQIYDTNNVFVQTFAGSGFFGYVDGQGTQTMFNSPTAVVADSVSNLFVWDNANHRIRKIATDGTVSTFAGGGILTTGYGTNVSLPYDSRSMTIDHSNALWLATSPYLFRIGSDGYVSYASSTGIGYGSGICVDSANNICHGYGEMGDIHIDNFKATIQRLKEWRTETIRALEEVFPRAYEVRYFHCANIIPPARWEIQTQRDELKAWKEMLMLMLQNLERISDQLDRYTDLPLQARVYVEDVESFSKVRDINPERVRSVLKDGRIEIEEDKVQRAIENILGETFHKNDHGGEINDLSTHAKFCGRRRAAAFLLNGRGIRSRELQIADCGSNGDQIANCFGPQLIFTSFNLSVLFLTTSLLMFREKLIKNAVEGKTLVTVSSTALTPHG